MREKLVSKAVDKRMPSWHIQTQFLSFTFA